MIFFLLFVYVRLRENIRVDNDGYLPSFGIHVPYLSIYQDDDCEYFQYYESFTAAYDECVHINGSYSYQYIAFEDDDFEVLSIRVHDNGECAYSDDTYDVEYLLDGSCQVINGAYVRYTVEEPDTGEAYISSNSYLAGLRIYPSDDCTYTDPDPFWPTIDIFAMTFQCIKHYEEGYSFMVICGNSYMMDELDDMLMILFYENENCESTGDNLNYAARKEHCDNFIEDVNTASILTCPHNNYTKTAAPYTLFFNDEDTCESLHDYRSVYSRVHEYGRHVHNGIWDGYVYQQCYDAFGVDGFWMVVTQIFETDSFESNDLKGIIVRTVNSYECYEYDYNSAWYKETCEGGLDFEYFKETDYGVIRFFFDPDNLDCAKDFPTQNRETEGISGYVDAYVQSGTPNEWGYMVECVDGMKSLLLSKYESYEDWDEGDLPDEFFDLPELYDGECTYSNSSAGFYEYISARCYDEFLCYGFTTNENEVCNSRGYCVYTDHCVCAEDGIYGNECQERIGRSMMYLSRHPIEIHIDWEVPYDDVMNYLGYNAPCDVLIANDLGNEPTCEFMTENQYRAREDTFYERRQTDFDDEEMNTDYRVLVLILDDGHQVDYLTSFVVRPVTNTSIPTPLALENEYDMEEEENNTDEVGFGLYTTLGVGIILCSGCVCCYLLTVPICYCLRQLFLWGYKKIKKMRKGVEGGVEDLVEKKKLHDIRKKVRRELGEFKILGGDDEAEEELIQKDKKVRKLEKEFRRLLEEEELSKIQEVEENEDM